MEIDFPCALESPAVKTFTHTKPFAVFSLAVTLTIGGLTSIANAQSLEDMTRDKNLTVMVEIDGSLPGFTTDQLSAYVTRQMTAAHVTSWRFQPTSLAPVGGDQPSNRIVWHFKQLPFAGGGVRYIGPALSKAREVFGVGRAVGIDAKIYLNDKYQATTFDQATVKGGIDDPGLAAAIQKVMKSIIANAMAQEPPDAPKLAAL